MHAAYAYLKQSRLILSGRAATAGISAGYSRAGARPAADALRLRIFHPAISLCRAGGSWNKKTCGVILAVIIIDLFWPQV